VIAKSRHDQICVSSVERLSKATLGKIEKSDQSVSLGGYAAVLFVLGLTERFGELADANHDLVGRRLEEENLPKRIRLPKRDNDHEQ
jgi:hypothetical protein